MLKSVFKALGTSVAVYSLSNELSFQWINSKMHSDKTTFNKEPVDLTLWNQLNSDRYKLLYWLPFHVHPGMIRLKQVGEEEGIYSYQMNSDPTKTVINMDIEDLHEEKNWNIACRKSDMVLLLGSIALGLLPQDKILTIIWGSVTSIVGFSKGFMDPQATYYYNKFPKNIKQIEQDAL